MILTEVKSYVKQHQRVKLGDISRHFDIEAEALRGLLEFWVKKGVISHCSSNRDCGMGCHCDIKDQSDWYEWN